MRCITQAGYEVEPGGIHKHEKLEISDWTAGADEDEDNEDEDGHSEDSGVKVSEGDESEEDL